MGIARMIISPCHATWSGKGWCRMLCCWDDATQGTTCIRPGCRYNHASALLHGAKVTADTLHELFKIIPCTMAGMPGGCRHHNDLTFGGWVIPRFKLAVEPPRNNELVTCEPLPAEENELLPLYIEGKWVLQKKLFHDHVNDSVLKFLNGGEQDDIDECDEIFRVTCGPT